LKLKALFAIQVLNFKSCEFATFVFAQPSDLGIVEEASPEIIRCLCEVDGQPGIVKLSVVVGNCSLELLPLKVWKASKGFFLGDEFGGAEAEAASHPIVEFQPDAVLDPFPPGIDRDEEGLFVGEVRGVFEEKSTLFEGFKD
jgi:hypothetical protein